MDKPTEIKAGQIWAISDIRYYLLIEKDKHSQKGEWRAYGWDDHGSCLALVYEFELGESLEYVGEYNPAGNAELFRQNAAMRAALEKINNLPGVYNAPGTLTSIPYKFAYAKEIASEALRAAGKDGE